MAQKWEVTLRLTSDPSNNPDQNVFPASDEKGGFAIFEKHMNLGNIVVIQDVKVSDSVREIVMHYPNETKCNEIRQEIADAGGGRLNVTTEILSEEYVDV